MVKIDHERPKYEWDRIRPDNLDYDLLSVGQGKSCPQFIRKQGKKWVLIDTYPNDMGSLYATLCPANRKNLPEYAQKVVVGIIFTDSGAFTTSLPFPQVPIILYKLRDGFDMDWYPELIRNNSTYKSIGDYLFEFYLPTLALLISEGIVTNEHLVDKSQFTVDEFALWRG